MSIRLDAIFLDLQLAEVDETKVECKGQIYRCYVERYVGKRGDYVEKVKMLPLKRKSCPGCEKCGWVDETIRENISCENPPIMPVDPQNNDLYTIIVTNEQRDWETGYVDDFDLEFIKIKE